MSQTKNFNLPDLGEGLPTRPSSSGSSRKAM
jgi:hypothetical protein